MTVGFLPLATHHFPLLLSWLETPHVKKWWDQDIKWTHALISEKFGSYAEGYKLEQGIKKPMYAFIIVVDDAEIGYIQLYNAHDFPREGYLLDELELPRLLAAFDMLIGDESYVGKGYGTIIIKQFLAEFVEPHYEACFVDPERSNVSALKAYEKVGFTKIKELGTSVLMIYTMST